MGLLCEEPGCAQPANCCARPQRQRLYPGRFRPLRYSASNGLPVYHEFHGHFARASDARPLEMPIRCLINWTIMDIVRRTIAVVESSLPEVIPSVRRDAVGSRTRRGEVIRNLHSGVHCPSFRQPHLLAFVPTASLLTRESLWKAALNTA